MLLFLGIGVFIFNGGGVFIFCGGEKAGGRAPSGFALLSPIAVSMILEEFFWELLLLMVAP